LASALEDFAAKGGVSFEADGWADAYGFVSSVTDGTLENAPEGTFNALLAYNRLFRLRPLKSTDS